MSFKKIALLTIMMAAGMGSPFMYSGERRRPAEPKPEKGLPRWNVGGHVIYAKNEKDALKYARKRGLYRDGMEIKLIDGN